MKILIIITRGDSIGGAQTHVLSLAEGLVSKGHDVLICYGGKIEGPFNELIVKQNLNYTTIPNLRREISLLNDALTVLKIHRLIKTYSPDVLSLHSSKAGIVGRIGALLTKVPVVLTIHGWAFTEGVSRLRAIFYKSIEKFLAVYATKIIVVSNFDKEMALKYNILRADDIEVIHNGVNIFESQSDKNLDNNVVNITMIARFDFQKDHETLILACKNIENIKVHLLGDGPNLSTIKNLAQTHSIAEKFIFYGYSNNVDKVLKYSDIFVLISNWEGFPISTLEAMRYSLPIIISDVGGAKEAIIENITGYSIGRKNIQELTDKLSKLVLDKELRDKMGRAGRERLAKNFSSNMMCDRTLQIYMEAVLKKRK